VSGVVAGHVRVRVLLVEDNVDDAVSVRRTLGRARQPLFEVVHVESLREALARLESDPFDIVLLDLSLPDSCGLHTLSSFFQASLPRRPPIIVLTGDDDERLAVSILQAGAQEYLVKGDLGSRTLVRTLLGAIERHRMAQELQLVRERAQRMATHCPLTNLPNRYLFEDRLSHAVAAEERAGGRLAVLFLDLDRFKLVNDTLGHYAADEVLRTVARRLLHCIRASDTAARLGGDEFIVILRSISRPVDAGRVARKILRALSEPIFIEGRELYVSASVGIAIFPEDGDDVETLVRHADAAMYLVKERGRDDYHFYTDELNLSSSSRLALETNLRKAVQREQFLLHFQPKVCGDTRAILGVEALLRWRHPQHGLIPPLEFVPLAEETGLIVEIGEWALLEACRQSRAWQRSGLAPTPVAVNVSPRQFWRGDFYERVHTVLDRSGLEASLLDLEITESCLLSDVEAAIRILQMLRNLGVRISIDDFGTGFSSLGLLKRLPLDCLKIDRCFVRELPGEARDAHIASVIISLAHGLDLEAVAEGVETEEQRDFLLERGCRSMQGFLFSEPLAAAELEPLLARGRVDAKRAGQG
jgi:diguanylate cyclase (GGDEF)-like protein